MRFLTALPTATLTVLCALACGGGGPASVEEAQELCAKEDPEGCLYLAELFETEAGAREEHPEAFEVYVEISCGSGLASACYDYGFIRLTGEGGEKIPAEAALAFATACDANEGRACHILGEQTLRGDGVAKNAARARELFERACDLGVAEGCNLAGRLLAGGQAGEIDIEGARALYARGCELDPSQPFCKK